MGKERLMIQCARAESSPDGSPLLFFVYFFFFFVFDIEERKAGFQDRRNYAAPADAER